MVSFSDEVRSFGSPSPITENELVIIRPSPRISERAKSSPKNGRLDDESRVGKDANKIIEDIVFPLPQSIKESDIALSPVEKTLLHQISKLSEELEVSRQRNELLERIKIQAGTSFIENEGDDFDEDDMTILLRLGMKTIALLLFYQ